MTTTETATQTTTETTAQTTARTATGPEPAPPGPPLGALGRLEHLPIGVFAVVMGLGGTAAAWSRAGSALGAPAAVGRGLAWSALVVLAVAGAAYLVKVARFPAAAAAEWRSPAKVAFVPTTSIGLVILAVALLDVSRPLSAALWWTGAVAQLALTVYVLSRWIADPGVSLQHVHPAWFIPVVGNLVVPLAGVEHAPAAFVRYFFAVGVVFWLALLPLVLGRLILGGPLPGRLTPTLAVFVAPPAVAALSWVRLGGRWSDPVAQIFLDVTIFQLLVLAAQVPALRRAPFAISAWATSFPLAAATSALLAAGQAGAGEAYGRLGEVLLAVLTVLVVALGLRTAVAVRRGEICRPEG